jgi:hypothetical protein
VRIAFRVVGLLMLGYALLSALCVATGIGGPYANYDGWASYALYGFIALIGLAVTLATRGGPPPAAPSP